MFGLWLGLRLMLGLGLWLGLWLGLVVRFRVSVGVWCRGRGLD